MPKISARSESLVLLKGSILFGNANALPGIVGGQENLRLLLFRVCGGTWKCFYIKCAHISLVNFFSSQKLMSNFLSPN